MIFAVIQKANTALPKSSLTVAGDKISLIFRATTIISIDDKSHKLELKSSRNLTNHKKLKIHH